MGRSVIPVADLGRRMVEHGRIRLGIKSGKAMKSIDTFRFTSPDKFAIEQLAEQYGGEAKAWSDPKASPTNQFEVVTKANDIAVWIMPGGLDVSYEMWSGGGCVRRCDGVECETSQRSFDADYEPVMVQCICDAKQKMECRPYTRLNVVIPSIRFGGSWRLESKGWNAAEELPGMADMISQLQDTGVLRGRLRLEHRQSQGGRRKFVVPTLAIDMSVEEILSGSGSNMMLNQGVTEVNPINNVGDRTPLSLNPQPVTVDVVTVEGSISEAEDEVVEAELIESSPDQDIWLLPNAPREQVDLTERQVAGLLSGQAVWSAVDEGKVVKA
jgi:hypothetical protein